MKNITAPINDTKSQVYLASDIQRVLGLGRTKTYDFLNEIYKQENPPFRVIKIGASVRVPKESFDAWLNAVSDK